MPYIAALDLEKIDLNRDVSSSYSKDGDGNWVLARKENHSHFDTDFHRERFLFNDQKPFPFQGMEVKDYNVKSDEQKIEITKAILESFGLVDKYQLYKNNYDQEKLLRATGSVMSATFHNIDNATDMIILPVDSLAKFYQTNDTDILKITSEKICIKTPDSSIDKPESYIEINVKTTLTYKLLESGTVLESIIIEGDKEDDVKAIEAIMLRDLDLARPYYKNLEKKLLLSGIELSDCLTSSKSNLEKYLNLLDAQNEKVQIAKNILVHINAARTTADDLLKYIDIIKRVVSLVNDETKDIEELKAIEAPLMSDKRIILKMIQTSNNFDEANKHLKNYLQLLDRDDRVKAAKNVSIDLEQIKPAPSERTNYLQIVKDTADLATGNTRNMARYERQYKNVHTSHLLRNSMLLLAGVALIGLSVGLAVVSHGATLPLSIAGVKLGVTLIFALVHAKAGLGLVSTVASVGLFGKSMNKPTNFLQENMKTLTRTARAPVPA